MEIKTELSAGNNKILMTLSNGSALVMFMFMMIMFVIGSHP